jgi:hypothetical protein
MIPEHSQHSDLVNIFLAASPIFTRTPTTTMGQVLSTPSLADSLVIRYQCPRFSSTDSRSDFEFEMQYSPMLSSKYDPEKIVTISDSESD